MKKTYESAKIVVCIMNTTEIIQNSAEEALKYDDNTRGLGGTLDYGQIFN